MPQSSPILCYFYFSNCLFGLEVLTRGITSVKLFIKQLPNSSPLSVHCFLSFRSYQFIHLKKNTWALSHEFKHVSFSLCSFVNRNKCLCTHLSTHGAILDHLLRLRGSLTKIKSSNFDDICRIIGHKLMIFPRLTIQKFLYSDKIYGYSSISNKLSFGLTTISVEETLSCFSLLDIDLFFFGNRPRRLWFTSKKNFRHSSFVSCLNWKYIALAVEAIQNAYRKVRDFDASI